MPKLADLGIAEIKIYYKDHAPPHIHAFHTEGVVKIAVETLEVLKVTGRPPSSAILRQILKWIRLNRPSLLAAFYDAQRGIEPKSIG